MKSKNYTIQKLFLSTIFILLCFGTMQAQIPNIKSETTVDISDFQGTPYVEEKFKKATVYDGLTNKERILFLRYDAHNDVFEMKKSLSEKKYDFLKKTMEIHLEMDGKTFYYRQYTNDEGQQKWGYLHKIAEIEEQNFYMKYGKTLIMPQPAKTSLEQDRPGKIKDKKYYVVGKNKQLASASINKKTILNYIPVDKRNDVKTILKKEKLKFKNSKDIKTLADNYSKL